MADSACLTGNAAACNSSNDVKLLDGVCEGQGLTNDQLEGLQTEIVVDGTAVDCDRAASGIYSYSCNRVLSSAGAILIRLRIVHCSYPPYILYSTGF